MFKKIIFYCDINHHKITDDDFEENILIRRLRLNNEAIHNVIIDFYSKRNLPVVKNLIKFMLWYRDKYSISLDNQYLFNKLDNSRWIEVDKEIKKYLLFS